MIIAPTKTYQITDHDLLFEADESAGYTLRVRDLPDADRPRERMVTVGAGELSVAELLAIIWGVGNRNEDVLAMAKRTLKEYGEKSIANETDPQRLADTANIPLAKACQVIAGFEIGRRYYSKRAGRPIYVRNAGQAYHYLRHMGFSQKEQLVGLYLNSRYRVVHEEIISIGSMTASIVHPREVFQPAIEHGAVGVILAHNHPSGQLEPTRADIAITSQLKGAGALLGIELVDHIIVATTRYASIMEVGDGV